MTANKARKKAARQRAAETGESYTRAARQAPADRRDRPDVVKIRRSLATYRAIMSEGDVPFRQGDAQAHRLAEYVPALVDELDRLDRQAGAPPVFTPDVEDGHRPALSWSKLVEYLDQAEAHLDDPDPYAQAAAFASRAMLYMQLCAQTSDAVYAAACARASVCDDITAARIRFENTIPNIRPSTEATLITLRTCSWCGRPWQASADGACPHCPRMLFGPTPASRAEAEKTPAAVPAAPLSARELLRDVLATAIETGGGGCDHSDDVTCSTCLADIALNALARSAEQDPTGQANIRADNALAGEYPYSSEIGEGD